jgi:hypothetical protein
VNRRDKNDRRSWGKTKPFPFKDSSGEWVRKDRRVLLGRRRNSIESVWQELEELYDFSAIMDSSRRLDP